jgi:hypothetical protein
MDEGEIRMPPVVHQWDGALVPEEKLGILGKAESRLTVGHSDALPATAADALNDKQLAAYLDGIADRVAIIRLTFHLSFRPVSGERFEGALFSVVLDAPDASPADQPFARQMAPKTLESGPYKIQGGVGFSFHGEVPVIPTNVDIHAGRSTSADIQRCYVIAEGEGESDPGWRYQRTKTMDLEGTHEMGLLVQLNRGVTAEARLSLAGTVHAGIRTQRVAWEPDKSIGSIVLESD